MALTKKTTVDKCETKAIYSHYCLQVRERIQVLEDGQEISATFHRYCLQPDTDVSSISDPLVLAQFNAVMTDQIKSNYQTFLESQKVPVEDHAH